MQFLSLSLLYILNITLAYDNYNKVGKLVEDYLLRSKEIRELYDISCKMIIVGDIQLLINNM